ERDAKGNIKGYDPAAIAIVKGGTTPMTGEQLRTRIEDGLADEVHRMLEAKVVAAAEDIDLCLILGAGYPFQMGGLTPYLDRVGASQRVFKDTFHHPVIRGTN
ncbi:MAG TPA: 3-hydroxyacyl-CoA dehydrogenase, partial [Galbitalea sp.]